MKKFFIIFVFIWLFAGKLPLSLEQKIANLKEDDTLSILIHLKSEEFYPSDFNQWSFRDKVNYLKERRLANQKDFLLEINQNLRAKQYWIGNFILVKITKSSQQYFMNLISQPKVDWLIEDIEIILDDEQEEKNGNRQNEIEWNIERIKAPEVWALGYTGKGITIGFLDSGVDSSHPDLKNRLIKAKNFTPWLLDPCQDDTLYDRGHGTHVVGIACGANGIGVAPKAKFMMAKVFHQKKSHLSWILDAFQWYAEMEDPPQILSNSWGTIYQWYSAFFEPLWTLRQLGFIIVFANGNWGPDTATAGAPGNYPQVIGVGATDTLDSVAWFSSRGPSYRGDQFNGYFWADSQYWPYSDWNFLKPDICAPGVNIYSSFPGGGYKIKMGTSMATPHIAGVIALMLEKKCDLTHNEIYQILRETADQPTGQNFPNYDYGWGIVNALKALEAIENPKENILVTAFPTIVTNQTKRVKFFYQLKSKSLVTAAIYDQAGRLIRYLIKDEWQSAGKRYLIWDSLNNQNQTVSSGVYFLNLRIGNKKNFSTKVIFLH